MDCCSAMSSPFNGVPALAKQTSKVAVAAKAAHDPQLPWLFPIVTRPAALRKVKYNNNSNKDI